jgi:hypothetical protein
MVWNVKKDGEVIHVIVCAFLGSAVRCVNRAHGHPPNVSRQRIAIGEHFLGSALLYIIEQ